MHALSEKSMRATANSDSEQVKVRSGTVLSERIRERLTEESRPHPVGGDK